MLMYGVGAEFVAQMMKYHLLLWEVVLNLHQKTDPKVQQDFKGQGHYDKVNGQIKVTP